MDASKSYGAFAKARAKHMPTRVGLAAFLAVVACVLSQSAAPLIWLAVVVAGQGVDFWISASMIRRPDVPPSTGRRVAYGLSMGLNAVVYSAIAAYLWIYGGMPGKAFAMLQPAGALLNLSLQLDRSPRLLLAAWGTHAAYMIGLPIVFGLVAGPMLPMIALSVGGLIYVVHIIAAVRNIRESSQGLIVARDEAQRASAAKSDFLATMSHEIRTPMNAVVSAAGLLRRTPLTSEQAGHVDMLSNASEVMMGLLNDVLDLAKIESGSLIVQYEGFDLVRKLEASAQLWRPRAEEKQITLEFDPGDLPQRVMTDPLRFQQVVFNLISNAVKFTAQGHIRLRGGRGVSATNGAPILWIEIEDTGCGMDAATAGRILGAFEQASAGATRAHDGAGLGLAIGQRLAQLMGGSLNVESQVGRGSTFRFETPLIEAEAEALPAEPVAVSPICVAGAPQVLLAEDHAANQRIVRLILEPVGFQVTVVENGLEAVAEAALRPYDVILMDMQMPVMGGIEATSLIKSGNGPNAATPILALTANALDEHRAQWAAVGVDVFMTKPVDMPALIENVWIAAGSRVVEDGVDEAAAPSA